MKYFILYFLIFPFLLSSQIDTSSARIQIDILKLKLNADSSHIYRFRKIRPYLNYHERHSLNNQVTTNFYGPQFGAVLYERHIAGFGIYFSGKKTREPFETTDNQIKVNQKIDVNFISAFYQYILINRRYYEMHIPLEFGSGTYYSALSDSSGHTYKTVNERIFLTGGSLLAILKPLKWIGLSGSIGYRITSHSIFNGYFYTLGIWVGLKSLQSDVRYHLIKKKKYKREVKAILKN